MSSTYAFFIIASAAFGLLSLLVSAVFRIAVIAMVGAGRSPNVRTVFHL